MSSLLFSGSLYKKIAFPDYIFTGEIGSEVFERGSNLACVVKLECKDDKADHLKGILKAK